MTLEDGVYIGLPEIDYFSQDALGSTDLAKLFEDREGWWWSSEHNPDHIDSDTRAKGFGSAVHCLLLEGTEAFYSKYFQLPAKNQFEDLLVTMDDLRSALHAAGAPKPAKNHRLADLVEMARMYLEGRNVWELIYEAAVEEAAGRSLLTDTEWKDLAAMQTAAMKEPLTYELFNAGSGCELPEISMFASIELPGMGKVRCRFRFDALRPQYTVDLKTVGDYRSGFEQNIARRISEWTTRLQAGWSFVMRKKAMELIAAGKVFGGTGEQRQLLERFPAEAPIEQVLWVWIFHQRPSATGFAPAIAPVTLQFDNPIVQEGIRAAIEALRFYILQSKVNGLESGWLAYQPPREAVDGLDWQRSGADEDTALRVFSPRKLPSPSTDINDVL